MNTVYIGIGSNIEPRKKYMMDAIQKLSEHVEIDVVKVSSIYETAPVGYVDQGPFLNMVIEISTALNSLELLKECQKIEQLLGRKRTIKNGPRTIDLDILLFNGENRNLDTLQIPHPRLHERAFVLVPLIEIAPHITLPTTGRLIIELLHNISEAERKTVVKWEH